MADLQSSHHPVAAAKTGADLTGHRPGLLWRSRTAALFAFAAVAAGAFGAHALKPTLQSRGTGEVWDTAVLYHLIHSVMLWFVAQNPRIQTAWWFFVVGIVLFSGSLYLLALVRVPALGPVTPAGGLCLLAGWMVLALKPPQQAA
jgi:uncharacterized membrane protein YgdD (TMEM256/DUF423 family)